MHYKKLISIILSASMVVGMGSGIVFADMEGSEDPEAEIQFDESEESGEYEDPEETYEDVQEEDGIIEDDTCDEQVIDEEESGDESDITSVEDEDVEDVSDAEDPVVGDPEVNAIPITDQDFPDQNFRAYIMSDVIDTDGDDCLSEDEIAAVTSLDVSGNGIYTLEGIEMFTALEILDCHNNSISELDLSGNPAVKKLYCQQNPQYCKIDISGNEYLKSVLNTRLRDLSETVYYKFATDGYELIFDRNAVVWTEDTILMGIGYYGGNGNDTADDSSALNNCCWEAVIPENGGRSIVIIIPAGTYYLNSKVRIFSNTSIYAEADATIISRSDSKGAMLDSEHTVSATDLTICRGSGCNHKGYTQAKNIIINGGTWDRGANNTTYQTAVFIFRHCENIQVSDLTMLNCTDHFLNVSGCKDVTVSHVTFKDSQLTGAFTNEKSYYTMEAVHTDYTNEEGENSDLAMPFDNTPTINVTVNYCTFDNVMAGIGTHHPVQGDRAHDYVINNNTFVNIHSYCLSAEGFDTVLFENNTCTSCNSIVVAKDCTNVTIRNNTQTKLYSGSTIDASRDMIYFYNVRNSTISNNVINNSRHTGIKVASGSSSVTIENNTINKSSEFGIMLQATDGAVSDISVLNNTINGTNTTTSAKNYSGIRVLGLSGTVLVSGNHILATNTERADSDGIFASDTPGIQIINNDIAGVGRRGISLRNCDTCTITGNTITNATEYGIMMEASADNQTSSFICKNNTISAQGNYAISVKYCKSVNLDGNIITKAAQQAIFIKYCATSTIKNNTISGAGSTGIWVDADSTSYLTKCTCSGNTIKSPGQYGIFIRYCKTVVVEGNTVNNAKDRAICIKLCTSCTVKTNVIKKPTNAGIWIEGSDTAYTTKCIVEGNTVESSTQYGIYLKYCKNGTVEGNTVKTSTDYGIFVRDSSSCTVKRNQVSDSGKKDIIIHSTCTNCTSQEWHTGWVKEDGKWYYYDSESYMQYGWKKLSGKWYYFDKTDGSMASGWKKIGGKWYLFSSGGVMRTGWQQSGGKWYYFLDDGSMKTGWIKLDGKWYHFDGSGAMQTSWQKLNNNWYCFGSNGAMKTGWYKTGGKWYYFNADGVMQTGKVTIDGKVYTFDANGVWIS